MELYGRPESQHRIYQSRRGPSSLGLPFDAPDAPAWAKAIELFPPIERVDGRTIRFEDGRRLEGVDLIMFATGYLYSFAFASPSHAPFSTHPLTVSPTRATPTTPSGGLRVHHLDARQLFYLPSPTLSFLALPLLVIPFPLAEAQAHLLAAYYSESRSLQFVAGVPEENGESKEGHVWGFPREIDETDELLREAGDGGEGGKRGRAELSRRELRKGCMGLRKSVLGY